MPEPQTMVAASTRCRGCGDEVAHSRLPLERDYLQGHTVVRLRCRDCGTISRAEFEPATEVSA